MRRLVPWIVAMLTSVLFATSSNAARINPERFYQEDFCARIGGMTNVVLSDGTRPDCVTLTHVYEVDFGDKWYEAVGQALHYARMSGLKPGILLVIESLDDERFAERLDAVAQQNCPPIEVQVYRELPLFET